MVGLPMVRAAARWSVIHLVPHCGGLGLPQPPSGPPPRFRKPSSPTDTMWLASRPLMKLVISVAQLTRVVAVQVPEVGLLALMQRGSLASSQEKIVGSFL